METELATWHFVVAAVLFMVIGAVAHVMRGVVNVYPDKISDTPAVNILFSDDYSAADHFWRVEFDDFGYYRLDSARNLKLSVGFTVAGGLAAMLFAEGAGLEMARLIEAGVFGFVDLFWQRIAELKT